MLIAAMHGEKDLVVRVCVCVVGGGGGGGLDTSMRQCHFSTQNFTGLCCHRQWHGRLASRQNVGR